MTTLRSLRPWLVFLLLPWVAQAREADALSHQRARQHAALALAQGGTPRGVAHLVRLHALRDDVDDLNLHAQTYATLLSRSRSHPAVRATSHLLYADIERARGLLTKARTVLQPLGFIQQFYVVGGFENEGKSGCDVDYGPEKTLDLTATYPGKTGEVSWHPLTVTSVDGYVDLAAPLRPTTETVAYALGFLEAAEEGQVDLLVGTSGAFRLFLNGHPIASDDRYTLPRPDQTAVRVKLRRGINRVLLKVCQENGPFGFYLRQERGRGSDRVKAVFPSSLPPLEKGPGPQPVALPTPAEWMEKEVRKAPGDARLRGDYATILSFTQAFEHRDHLASVEAERAASDAPADAPLQLLAAELQREDKNLRRRHLEAALKADPQSPPAQLALALHELEVEHPERALPLLKALTHRHPSFVPARLAYLQALEALGEWATAATLVETQLRTQEHLPKVMREAARVARRLDRPDEAIARLRTALGLRYDDIHSRSSLASLLAEKGQVGEAAEQYERLLALDPFNNQVRLRLAELYAANDRLAQAEAWFAEARALAPQDPEVYERTGRTLLNAGRRDPAIAAFRQSLKLRPQNPALKEVLRTLEGDLAPLGTQFVLNLQSLEKEADARFGKEDAVYLVDYSFARVQPSGQASRFHQLGVKVYTQRGVEAFRQFPITYSPNREEVQVLKARVTKADGSVVDSYSESERNMNEPWTGMYYDHRARVLGFPSLAPGDLLELQFRIDDTAQENLLSDYWGEVDYVQATYPKVRYQFLVEMPATRPLFWNKSQLAGRVTATQEPEQDGRVLYRYEAREVSKVVPEPSMPGWAEVATTLHVSTYRTWDQVGRYYWGLVRDQLTPNDELKRTVDRVLTGVNRKDELAVVRAVYNFVVTNTRYVALEFGIHGYKPYRVDRVLARKFGDCKDKASLIHAMLKVAGVDSRLVLLRMRHLGQLGEEPASLAAFNHAIAYVPKFQLYLDGTAEFHASRELPSADRVANVLVVEPEGASPFRTTPESSAEDNLNQLALQVALRPDGSAEVTGRSSVRGQNAPAVRRAYQATATRKQIFEQSWAQTFPGLTVKEVSMSDPSQLDSDVETTFRLQVPRYAEAMPQLVRFHPFAGPRALTETYAPLSERKFDLVMPYPWMNTVRLEHLLPPGYSLSELPADLEENSPFGQLSMRFVRENGKLIAEATLSVKVARVSARDYPAFRAWLGRVDAAFARKVSAVGPGSKTARR